MRFLAVLGPSGSGKSSVVLAGLIPRLKEGAIEGSERWPVAVVRPGDDPLKELGTAVAPQFVPAGSLPDASQVLQLATTCGATNGSSTPSPDGPDNRPGRGPAPRRGRPVRGGLHLPAGGRKEEGGVREDRAAFFANLLHAAAAPGGRVAVVLTMRSDFLGACASFASSTACSTPT